MAVSFPHASSQPVFLERPRATWAQNLVTVGLGLWLIGGVFIDGYAHNNLRSTIESFFTPWHAALYSGYMATSLWIVWLIASNLRRGARGWTAIPRGYGLGLTGVLIFGAGGMGDLVWHSLFGIEVGTAALLSPSHLMLLLGGVLIVTSPLRSAWASVKLQPNLLEFLPALLSALLALSFVTFMHMYLWVFTARVVWSRSWGDVYELASLLFSNVIVTGLALFLVRRWRTPFGTFTLLYGINSFMMLAIFNGFSAPLHATLLGFGAGLAVDVLALWLRPSPRRILEFRAFATLMPLSFWGAHFLVRLMTNTLDLELELWTGAAVMAALTGLTLSVLAVPPALPKLEEGVTSSAD
jgi:hypothetical protein